MTCPPMKHRARVSAIGSLSGRVVVVFLSFLVSSGTAAAQEAAEPNRETPNDRSAQQDPESRRGQGRGDQGRGRQGGRGGDGGEFRGRRGGDGPRGGRGGRGGRGRDRGDGFPGGGPDQGRGGGPEGRRGGDPATRGLGIMGTPEGLFTPDYMTRDVPMVIAELKLEDDQRSIVVELFNIYDKSFREALDALRAETEQVRESYEPDPAINEGIERVRDQMRDMRQEMREAREAFGRNGRPENPDQPAGREQTGREGGGEGQSQDGEEADQVSREQRREQADAMRADFRERFEVLRGDMRDMQEVQIKSDQMQAMFDQRMQMIRDFADTKRQLRESVESGLRALLLENQVEEWESIERKLRRKRLLSRGRLSGESTDVIDILEGIEISEMEDDAELSTLVAAYELELDGSLRQRENYDYTDALDFMDQLRKWEFEASLRNIRKRLVIQESIRDLNDQYIEAISVILPPLDREEFRRQGLMEGYSRIFRPTRVERVLVNTMEIEDLDPDVLEAVAELMQSHSDEIVIANEDLLVILRQEDSNRILERAEDRINRMQGIEEEDDEFDPMREAFDSREEIDDRYLATLESLLTPEQFEAVAGRRGRDGEGEGRRGGRDRGEFSREEFMKQFDRNGDGELDDEERNAMREQFRQRRGGGGRPQGPPPGEV